jgi:excisionase family DNA binding protein
VSDPPDDLISTTKAAAILRVQGRTVRGWVAAGKLAGWTLAGRRLLVSEADVKALLRPAPLKPRPALLPATARATAARKRHTTEILRRAGLLDY